MGNRSAIDLYENGRVLRANGRYEEAIAAYRQALELEPRFPEAANNLGNCLRIVWRLDDAEAAYRTALAAKPDFGEAWSNLGATLKNLGRADEAVASFERAVENRPNDPALLSNLIFCLHYASGDDPDRARAWERKWNDVHARPLRRRGAVTRREPKPGRPLRVGFVSTGFREQAQSFFTIPLFEHLQRAALEVIAYSDGAREDALTERVRGACAEFHSIAGQSDEEVAARVCADRIDVLVDLSVHAAQNRLAVFARRPAPVQVSWLGYPGSTGLNAIDYRLTDPWLDPPGPADARYAEQSWRLPDTFWCYDPLAAGPGVSELPCLAHETFTFGCLNNFSKSNARTFALWARVLEAVPASRLVLLAPPGSARQRAVEALRVNPERVRFADFQRRERYLETYREIDLGLDTFPYNGHTTSLDSWWMGVPVVSLRGRTAVSRAGYSQANNLRLPEFAVDSEDAFVAAAVEWAKSRARLAALRAGLRERMSGSPLMDRSRFARAFEGACRAMWDYCSAS